MKSNFSLPNINQLGGANVNSFPLSNKNRKTIKFQSQDSQIQDQSSSQLPQIKSTKQFQFPQNLSEIKEFNQKSQLADKIHSTPQPKKKVQLFRSNTTKKLNLLSSKIGQNQHNNNQQYISPSQFSQSPAQDLQNIFQAKKIFNKKNPQIDGMDHDEEISLSPAQKAQQSRRTVNINIRVSFVGDSLENLIREQKSTQNKKSIKNKSNDLPQQLEIIEEIPDQKNQNENQIKSNTDDTKVNIRKENNNNLDKQNNRNSIDSFRGVKASNRNNSLQNNQSYLSLNNYSSKISALSNSNDESDEDEDEEYEIWDNKDIRITNLLLDQQEDKANTNKFLSLYKARFGAFPGKTEKITNEDVIQTAVKFASANKKMFRKYFPKKQIEFNDKEDYSVPYDHSQDKNFKMFQQFYESSQQAILKKPEQKRVKPRVGQQFVLKSKFQKNALKKKNTNLIQ